MHLIEEAYELLRKTKNGVSTPQAEGNPSDIRDVQKMISVERGLKELIDNWAIIFYKYDSCKNHMNISQKITLNDNKCVKRYNEWLQKFDTYIIIRSYII